MVQSVDNEGWIEVKQNKRPKKNKDQQEQSVINDQINRDIMQSYYNDIKPIPPQSKEDKTKKLLTGSKKESAPQLDEDTTGYKIKAISVGQRTKLQKMRNNKGLTREDLAKKANVIVKIVADYENGKGSFDPQIYHKIINILDKIPDITI